MTSSLGSYPVAHLMGNSLYISSSPPALIPDALALNMTLISEPGLPFNSRRSITVYISGPTHLRLIVRDGQGGSRIVCWSLNGGNCISPPSARFDGSRLLYRLAL